VEAPPPLLVEESAHPYANNTDLRQTLHIKGAAKLLIRFDPRCHLHPTDMMTSISFYRDDGYQVYL
jgi:hypothetical protein